MTQDNKQLVEAAWRAYVTGDPAEAFASMAEGVRWIMKADFPGMNSDVTGHAALLALKDDAVGVFPLGLQQEIKSVIGEGDTVVLVYRAHGPVANGRYYDNEYCVVFHLENGKIQEIHEFTDTHRIANTVFG